MISNDCRSLQATKVQSRLRSCSSRLARCSAAGFHAWVNASMDCGTRLDCLPCCVCTHTHTHTHTTILQPFFWNHPGDPVPEENYWTLWREGRLTEADTPTIRLGATPSGLTGAHLHHPPIFLQTGCPSCCPTNSVKALKATSTFGLGRRR